MRDIKDFYDRSKVLFVRLTAAEYDRVLKALDVKRNGAAGQAAGRVLGPWARETILDRVSILESQDRTHPMDDEKPAKKSAADRTLPLPFPKKSEAQRRKKRGRASGGGRKKLRRSRPKGKRKQSVASARKSRGRASGGGARRKRAASKPSKRRGAK